MKTMSVLAALVVGLVFGAPQADAAVVLKFTPAAASFHGGQSVDIEMRADISDQAVVGFDLNLGFDDAIVELSNVVFGSAFDFGGLGGIWDPSTQWLLGGAFPDPVLGDDILLATLSFTGLQAGSTTLTAMFDPALSQGFALEGYGDFAAVTVQDATLNVPEPGTLALVFPALLGAGLALRRRPSA